MKQKGFSLLASVFIIIIFATLGVVLVSLMSSENLAVMRDFNSVRAFQVAEAGIRYTIASSLVADSDFTNNPDFGPITFGPGKFSVKYLYVETYKCTIEVTGTVNGMSRSIRVSIDKGSSGKWTTPLQLLANDYAIYVNRMPGINGNTCNFENGVQVTGNVFINNYLVLQSATPYVVISGNVYATHTITGNTSGVTGSINQNQTLPANAPTLESAYYDSLISKAGSSPTYSGDHTFNSAYSAGIYSCSGNAYVQSGFSATGVVTIVAVQTIQTSVNMPNKLWLVAGGNLTIGAGYTIGNDCYFFSRTYIYANPTTTGGTGAYQGVRFISQGGLQMNDNYNFRGFIYAGTNAYFATNITFQGLTVADNLTRLGQNCHFSKDPDTISFDSVIGIPQAKTVTMGSFEVFPWYEPY
jgi:hypothetical protein